MTTAQEYDAWYYTSRGAWIGEIEFRLLRDLLQAERGASLLDVGCGTGYFTRRFAGEAGLQLVGLDPNSSWLDFARVHGGGGERYCLGSAECLPFADRSFDYSVSVVALCFVEDARSAIREMLRVTRTRFAIGLLNRHSLLYLTKGRAGGSGAYRGAHWHTMGEVRLLLEGLPVVNLKARSAVFVAGGESLARGIECLIPYDLLLGSFLAIAGDVSHSQTGSRERPDLGDPGGGTDLQELADSRPARAIRQSRLPLHCCDGEREARGPKADSPLQEPRASRSCPSLGSWPWRV